MKEIKVGIVGSGFIAGVHCDAIAKVPGATVVAHCDTDKDRGASFAARTRPSEPASRWAREIAGTARAPGGRR